MTTTGPASAITAPTSDPTDGPIYLDYNATTPVDPRVLQALLPYLGPHFGNPSSAHHYSATPKAALARAREQVAALIGAPAEDIAFTASGSEANSLAIHGTILDSLTRDSPQGGRLARDRLERTGSPTARDGVPAARSRPPDRGRRVRVGATARNSPPPA